VNPSDLYFRVQRALRTGVVGITAASFGPGLYVGLVEPSDIPDAKGRPYSVVSHWHLPDGFGIPSDFPTYLAHATQRPGLPNVGMLPSYERLMSFGVKE
jgi:hypothetical protein